MAKRKTAKKSQASDAPKGKRISQTEVPNYSLEQALRVAEAIGQHGFRPTTPLRVASAMGMQPTSGPFRLICGSAIAYGLTKGGYNAQQIELQPLGLRIVRPTKEGDDLVAKREALLKPRIIGEFLHRYDGAAIPPEDIAKNVLLDLGVPIKRTEDVLNLVIGGAQSVGLIHEIKGRNYVELSSSVEPVEQAQSDEEEAPAEQAATAANGSGVGKVEPAQVVPPAGTLEGQAADKASRRVFITHGKNRKLIDPIKKLLGFGEMDPVVSVEKQSVSQPVPDKVMKDMRSCGGAIIHVEAEQKLMDSEAHEDVVLNPNVMIEIGAAMALYGRRFILLVKQGVSLPSNLQGLYEVRYDGDTLDGDATIRLLEAINDIKNHEMPDRYLGGASE